ncbi:MULTISPECIES: hypothetical protein [Mycolicibacterium]|nr:MULTISPECIES: hypothetical protein [Mycolicibacterium]NOP98319.1 hypothetical protein [Mycolicibacterium fortuitum]NOQ60928.1 hypothetical protein [Mycolicibacterium fortuitum]UBV15375.1 hypothetical protein H8Z57_00165 [Mycolicibacterium fortuitum]WAY19618.1 hypothetical protein OF855_00300 [Mycolicibacterium fortuitum]
MAVLGHGAYGSQLLTLIVFDQARDIKVGALRKGTHMEYALAEGISLAWCAHRLSA